MGEQGWKCPKCGKEHTKPHYAYRGQVDKNKDPLEEGRVKFNRVDTEGNRKYDTDWKHNLPSTGDAKDKHGDPNGLFCSHCGWEQRIIVLIRK